MKPSIFQGIASFRVIKFHKYCTPKWLWSLYKCLTAPIEPLITLSETLILSVNITLATTHNFNFAGTLSFWERSISSGIDMKHVFVSVSLLISMALKRTTSESSLPVQTSFSWPAE